MLMPLPNLAPSGVPTNCIFRVKNNTASGAVNTLGNPVITFTETEVTGWAVHESNPRIIATIGAAPEEIPLRVWITNLPTNFAAFDNISCEVTIANKKLIGIFRPVQLGHPFVPLTLQFVIGAFKGKKA